MRDLSTTELTNVYGAGGKGCSPKPPSRKVKCRGGSGSRGKGSRGKGSGSRRGKGGSS